MEVITVEEIIANSRIDTSDENEYLEVIGEVAEKMIENFLNRTWDDVLAVYGEYPVPLKHATLMLVDHLYQHRSATETQISTAVPFGIASMIGPYIKKV